jgi:hypothetical protein
MKTHSLLPAIFATATAFASGSAHSDIADAHAQAAALLSRPYLSGHVQASERQDARSASAVSDAHGRAAALLSGGIPNRQASASRGVMASPIAPVLLDAHAQAAALLSGTHVNADKGSRSTRMSQPLGAHPAVLVAQTWSARGIDPNSFIVAHPARLQLFGVSPSESQPQSAESVAGVRGTRLSVTVGR